MKVKSESEVVQLGHGREPTRLLHSWDFPGKSVYASHSVFCFLVFFGGGGGGGLFMNPLQTLHEFPSDSEQEAPRLSLRS